MSARLALILVLISGLACSQKGSSDIATILSKHTVWITKAIKWENAPKEINPDLSIGEATIICFEKNGSFGMLSCRVTRIDNRLAISIGDGYMVRQGHWKNEDAMIVLSHQLVYETLPPVQGRIYPGPEKVELATMEGEMQPEIRLSERIFVPVPTEKELSLERLQNEFFKYAYPVR